MIFYLLSHIFNLYLNSNKTPTPSTGRKIAVMTSCLLLQLIGTGVGYGLAVMYAELVQVFDAKRADAALIQSLFMGITTGAGEKKMFFISRFKCRVG